MKKILMLLFVGLATIGCSKDDEATPAPAENHALKVYNYTTHTEIKDGDVVVFTGSAGLVDPTNALKFYFKNTSTSEMKVKMRIVSVDGVSNLDSATFCYGPNINDGVCAPGSALSIGASYPRNSDAQIVVPANGTAGSGGANKFQNTASPVSPATAVNYVIEAFQVSSSGAEVGNKVRFTYRYQ